jgi:hypothetical protein
VQVGYEDAIRSNRSPLQAIARRYESEGMSRPTVRRWVKVARERGFLGYRDRPGKGGFAEETSPRKPGGKQSGEPTSGSDGEDMRS